MADAPDPAEVRPALPLCADGPLPGTELLLPGTDRPGDVRADDQGEQRRLRRDLVLRALL